MNFQRLPPGRRSSWAHAESDEEELVYVIEGKVDSWIGGEVLRMQADDLWHDAPPRKRGSLGGLPDQLRDSKRSNNNA